MTSETRNRPRRKVGRERGNALPAGQVGIIQVQPLARVSGRALGERAVCAWTACSLPVQHPFRRDLHGLLSGS